MHINLESSENSARQRGGGVERRALHRAAHSNRSNALHGRDRQNVEHIHVGYHWQ